MKAPAGGPGPAVPAAGQGVTGPAAGPGVAGPADRQGLSGTVVAPETGRVVVIGVGNEFRRDDGIGPAVLSRLPGQAAESVQLVLSDGDPARLIEAWTGASLAVVVDAVRADQPVPGRLHRMVLDRPDDARPQPVSSHGLGLSEAIGLARALARMPGRLVIHAVEAADFGPGIGLTAAVAAAADALTAAVLADLAAG
jgi:hydrogenase maturation protease